MRVSTGYYKAQQVSIRESHTEDESTEPKSAGIL